MASSTQNQHQLLPNFYGGATAAPPPTPSNNVMSTSDAADALSLLLHRLPPTLSLPTRRSSPTPSSAATCPPSLSFSEHSPDDVVSSVSQLGFAQLTDHSVSSELANSAESEALALFDLPSDQKESLFPKNWPMGYEGGGDGDDEDGLGESFRFDSSCSTESGELALTSLREFACALEKLGLKIIDSLAKGVGFENPVGDDPTRIKSIMWISDCVPGVSGGYYPFIVGLQYQIRCQKYSMLSDSGWVSVLPHVDSILVTVGDIAQVWSNGKLKKVRGARPMAVVGDKSDSRSITMSLLITLPTESTVAPLLPNTTVGNYNNDQKEEDEKEESNTTGDEGHERAFNSFDFEDYAWRVYHERLLFKDPLDRYRVDT